MNHPTSCTRPPASRRPLRWAAALSTTAAVAASGLLAAPSASAAPAASSASAASSVQVCATPVYAINVGGPQVTTSGRTWAADSYGRGGHTWTNPAKVDIEGTDDDVLYRSERAGHVIKYRLPVSNGTYRVRLHMAEIWWKAPQGSELPGRRHRPGKRVMSVSVNNHRVIKNFDPAAATGGTMRAVSKSVLTSPRHHAITLTGTARTDMAQLAAIEVDRVSACR